MIPGQQIIFIDHRGQSWLAVVTLELGDDHINLEYRDENRQRKTADNVPHIAHPSKQENNPDFPSYPLYAWKRVDEDHLELPVDHPVLDPVFQYREFREGKEFTHNKEGKLVERKRPHFDGHVRLHRAGLLYTRPPMPRVAQELFDYLQTIEAAVNETTGASALQLGHPAHPETIKFQQTCENCQAQVWRTASHHGGKVYDEKDGQFAEHVCSAPESHISDTQDAKPEHELWCAFFNTGKECDCNTPPSPPAGAQKPPE